MTEDQIKKVIAEYAKQSINIVEIPILLPSYDSSNPYPKKETGSSEIGIRLTQADTSNRCISLISDVSCWNDNISLNFNNLTCETTGLKLDATKLFITYCFDVPILYSLGGIQVNFQQTASEDWLIYNQTYLNLKTKFAINLYNLGGCGQFRQNIEDCLFGDDQQLAVLMLDRQANVRRLARMQADFRGLSYRDK